jgi:hypothetical protein
MEQPLPSQTQRPCAEKVNDSNTGGTCAKIQEQPSHQSIEQMTQSKRHLRWWSVA